MLVDLERNDMGRVANMASVEVNELMVNESYSHVIHIVSNIQGRLHARRDALDLLRAMFPGGTIHRLPQGPLHGDNRRAGAGPPRSLYRAASQTSVTTATST